MRVLFFLMAIIATTSVSAQTSNGLVARWSFNGNANDVSGNGHHGTAHNVSYVAGKNGINNTAAKFSGNSFVSIPNHSDLSFNKYTICTYIRIDSFNTYHCQNSTIIRKGAEFSQGAWGMQLTDNAYDSSCTITGDTSHFVFACDAGTNSANVPHGHWQYNPQTHSNTWYCIVTTYDSTQYKVYVNGVLKTTAFTRGTIGPIGSNNDSVVIGGNMWNNMSLYPYWLYGTIDDLQVYNRVLTPSEIDQFCNGGLTVDTSFKDTVLCAGKSFSIDVDAKKTYNSNNVFSAELSDANGSFASPVIIGTLTSQTSGTISCFIPANTPVGNGYRIRIIASSPQETSDNNGFNISIQNTQSFSVLITSSPSGQAPQLTPVTFSAVVSNGGNNPSYQWRKNGFDIPGETNDTYTGIAGVDFTIEDTITVFVKSSLKCTEPDSTTSNGIVTIITVSASNIDRVQDIIIAPNPNNGTFSIKGLVQSHTVSVTIYNMVGQVIYQEEVSVENNKLNHTINLNNKDLPSGVYQLKIMADQQQKTTPIFIR